MRGDRRFGDRSYTDGGIAFTDEDLRDFDKNERIIYAEQTRVESPETFKRLFPDWPIDKPYTG